MSDQNLSSIPLPSEMGSSDKPKLSTKKCAKDMLKEALKNHSDAQEKDTCSSSENPTHQMNEDDLSSSKNIVDMLFKDFITRKIAPVSVSKNSKSSASEKNSAGISSVCEISQFLDKEIMSIQSNSIPSTQENINKVEEKVKGSGSSDLSNSSHNSDPKSVSGNVLDKLKVSYQEEQTSNESAPINEPSTSDDHKPDDTQNIKSGSVSNDQEAANSATDQPDKPPGKALSMLPLPLARKAAKPKMLFDLKLSKESSAIIKEKETVNEENSQFEEGELVSSNSGAESEKNGVESESDSEDQLPSGDGSADSTEDEKKKHSSKRKKKHKHKHKKKKKKKKKSKNKEKLEKGEKKKERKKDGIEKPLKTLGSDLTCTIVNDTALEKESKHGIEGEHRKRKGQSLLENKETESGISKSDDTDDQCHKKLKVDVNELTEKEGKDQEKKKERKKRRKSRSRSRSKSRSRSRSRSPKRSKHSSSHAKSSSKSRDRDGEDEWDAYRYKDDLRNSKSHRRDKDKERRRSKEKSDTDLRVRIDKAKLRKIAIANALQNMKSGQGPTVSISTRAGGKSVEELTDFCKKISEKDRDRHDSDFSDSEEEQPDDNEDESLIHHPFKLKDTSANIVLNIRNAKQLPVMTPSEKQAQQATLRLAFPVSSGSHHRATESEWVPVEPKKPPTEVPVASTSKHVEKKEKPTVEAPKPPAPSIFPNQDEKKVDIGSIISERLQAVRKLQENPHDIQALSKMFKAQEQANKWVNSKMLPGQFLGSTGAQVLSQAELIGDRRHQAWVKKGQLSQAAPVNGGIGMFLLQKMGWKQGEGLGKNNEGSKLPLLLDVKMDRKGLVAPEEQRGAQRGKAQQAQQQPRAKDLSNKHPVSALMELCKRRKWGPPEFTLVSESGPDHKKNFLFRTKVNNIEYQPAVASSNKKMAKAQCAAVCLQEMGLLPRDAPINI